MKKVTLVSLIFCLLFAVSGLTLLAQTNANALDDLGNANNPVTNQRANACYWGSSLGGMCDTAWEWECGWGAIRVEYGLIPSALLSQQCQTFRTTPNAAQFMATPTSVPASSGSSGSGAGGGSA